MNVGFIGTGSMGKLLIEALIRSGALKPSEIVARNRTARKAEELAARYPGLLAADSVRELAERCEMILICVKPMEYPNVLEELAPVVRSHQIVVSITSPIMIRQLESRLDGKIVKMIPSVTNGALSGSLLFTYGERIGRDDRCMLERLFGTIGKPVEIDERHTRIASDLSSCGPAFFAMILRKWVEAAVAETGIDPALANRLACEMLYGTGRLLTEYGMTPTELEQRVAVPGGITAEGLRVLEVGLSGVYQQLIRTTHEKYAEDIGKLNAVFQEAELN